MQYHLLIKLLILSEKKIKVSRGFMNLWLSLFLVCNSILAFKNLCNLTCPLLNLTADFVYLFKNFNAQVKAFLN